jgi:hypothetical protein
VGIFELFEASKQKNLDSHNKTKMEEKNSHPITLFLANEKNINPKRENFVLFFVSVSRLPDFFFLTQSRSKKNREMTRNPSQNQHSESQHDWNQQ